MVRQLSDPTSRTDRLADFLGQNLPLTGSIRRGLKLRPPRRFLRLLHLAREHAWVVAYRPISFGNKQYLQERIHDLNLLGEEILNMTDSLNSAWAEAIIPVAKSLRSVTAEYDERFFPNVVAALDRTGYRRFWQNLATAIPAGEKPLLRESYDQIVMVTGPALGLGDEIACAEFIRHLKAAFSDTPTTIFGFYPSLWKIIEPEASVKTLVGKPMRAFDYIDHALRLRPERHTLLLFINFSGLDFHLAFFQERVRPEVIEIAIGKGCLWFVPNDGGYIRVLHALDRVWPNNYHALRQFAQRLVGPLSATSAFTPDKSLIRSRKKKKSYQILISPLTSKQIVLSPSDWVALIQVALPHVSERKSVSCFVIPGLTQESETYAGQIEEEARLAGVQDFQIKVFDNGSSQGMAQQLALRNVVRCIKESNMVLGVDTYTAHLAALLGVPSVAFCYGRNVAFWSDQPQSWWVEMRHGFNILAEVVALMFRLTGGLTGAPGKGRKTESWSKSCLLFEKSLDPRDSVNDREQIQKVIDAGNSAWQGASVQIKKLVLCLDSEYAWPKIAETFAFISAEENAASWLLNVIRHTHFRRICALSAGLN